MKHKINPIKHKDVKDHQHQHRLGSLSESVCCYLTVQRKLSVRIESMNRDLTVSRTDSNLAGRALLPPTISHPIFFYQIIYVMAT